MRLVSINVSRSATQGKNFSLKGTLLLANMDFNQFPEFFQNHILKIHQIHKNCQNNWNGQIELSAKIRSSSFLDILKHTTANAPLTQVKHFDLLQQAHQFLYFQPSCNLNYIRAQSQFV